ncbi:MAG: VanZ family protein [Bacteroidota bacterium]
MSVFTSKREKRLWAWTLAVVLAIYSTLGLANTLADTFFNHEAIGAGLFLLCCFLVLGTVLSQGWKRRPSDSELVVALGVIAAYVLVFVRMSIPTERSHLIEYGVVAIFIYEALLERIAAGKKVVFPAIVAIVLTSLIGGIDECIQGFLPNRVFDPVDMLFNVLAAVMAIGASSALRWARRRRPRPSP